MQLSEKIETNSFDVAGDGLASKPICGFNQDAAWLLCRRHAQAGRLQIESASREASGRSGYMRGARSNLRVD